MFQPDNLGTVSEAGLRFVGWFKQAGLGVMYSYIIYSPSTGAEQPTGFSNRLKTNPYPCLD
jgi:hypothetical protein